MGSRRVALSLDRPRQLKEIQAQYRISQMFGELLHDPSVSQKNWKNMKRYVNKNMQKIEKYVKDRNVKRKPKRKTTKTDGFFTISRGFSHLWISCHDLKSPVVGSSLLWPETWTRRGFFGQKPPVLPKTYMLFYVKCIDISFMFFDIFFTITIVFFENIW